MSETQQGPDGPLDTIFSDVSHARGTKIAEHRVAGYHAWRYESGSCSNLACNGKCLSEPLGMPDVTAACCMQNWIDIYGSLKTEGVHNLVGWLRG